MKAHDVRHLRICPCCQALGDDREMVTIVMHGRCAFDHFGIGGLLKLPDEERNKLTIGDIGPAAMKVLVEDYERRQRADESA
jgi:hypothetical protein